MDIRNVQKTGNMFYMYLPSSWCKKFKIDSDSKVQVETDSHGNLTILPTFQERKPKHIELKLDESDIEIINKLIVACYINPASSFEISLKEKLDYASLLDQKKLIPIELVEFYGKTIKCESSVMVTEPHLLLKTMINKIKNMLIVMTKGHKELIERYEEEIDRNRLLIDKSIINSLTFNQPQKSRTIDLYYISQMARDLERLADHLILINEKETEFIEEVIKLIDELRNIIEMATEKSREFDYNKGIDFAKKVKKMKDYKIKDIESYYKTRIKNYLENISEVIIDWAITNEVES